MFTYHDKVEATNNSKTKTQIKKVGGHPKKMLFCHVYLNSEVKINAESIIDKKIKHSC